MARMISRSPIHWLAAACVAALTFAAVPGHAQDNTVAQLTAQIEQLRTQLNTLQRDYYNGRVPTGPAAAAPLALDPAQAANAAQFEVRLSQIEDETRALVGTLEAVRHDVDSNRTRLDKLVQDVDFRLAQIEARMGNTASVTPAPGPAAPAVPQAAAPTPAPATRPAPGVQGIAGLQPGQQVLGTLPATQPVTKSILPNGTPRQQYEFAYNLLVQLKYANAQQALREFIAANGGDELTYNARYWLGETYYAQQQYRDAASAFLEAYTAATPATPGGPWKPKAADSLLKLGMSLARWDNHKTEACAALAPLNPPGNAAANPQFPTTTPEVRGQAAAELKRLGC